jgi:hypothetical protein
VQNTELRPLGAGEMLDRAITLYVRRFPQIVLVLAVVSVPLILVQALVAPQSAHVFSDLAQVFSATGSAASRRAGDAMAADSAFTPLAFVVIFAAMIVRVLMWSAIIALVSAAYAGTRTTLADAYRLAVKRWVPQMVVGLTFMILGGMASIPLFIVYFVAAFVLVGLSFAGQTVAVVVVAVIVGVVFIAGLAVIGSFVFMTYELAAVAIVTETGNPVEAVQIALRRAVAPGMKRRTVVAGLVLFLVSEAGALPLIGLAAAATMLTHIDALYFAVLGTGGVLLDGIVAAFAVVYAVDVRVRREGYDLVVAQTA